MLMFVLADSHLAHIDSSVPSSQSLWPLHFFCAETQRPFRHATSPALHDPADGAKVCYKFSPKILCIINVLIIFFTTVLLVCIVTTIIHPIAAKVFGLAEAILTFDVQLITDCAGKKRSHVTNIFWHHFS